MALYNLIGLEVKGGYECPTTGWVQKTTYCILTFIRTCFPVNACYNVCIMSVTVSVTMYFSFSIQVNGIMSSENRTFENVKAVILSAHKDTTSSSKITFYDNWAENYDQVRRLKQGYVQNMSSAFLTFQWHLTEGILSVAYNLIVQKTNDYNYDFFKKKNKYVLHSFM